MTKIPRFNFDKFYLEPKTIWAQRCAQWARLWLSALLLPSPCRKLCAVWSSILPATLEIPGRAGADAELLKKRLSTATRYRLTDIATAFAQGWSLEEVYQATKIDRWFLDHLLAICESEKWVRSTIAEIFNSSGLTGLFSEFEKNDPNTDGLLKQLKVEFFSDAQIASFVNAAAGCEAVSEHAIYALRQRLNLVPVFKAIDTCAGEFPTKTNYLYSTFAPSRVEYKPQVGKKVVILGSGPNRIGQAIEFDYCCVQASLAIKEQGMRSIIVNCNPETVSTDFDVSDVLYFEPLTLESVSNILSLEKADGVIVQFGGQTPLNLAEKLEARGFKILGTSVEAIKLAEDRSSFRTVLSELGIRQPEGAIVHTREEALKAARLLGFPVLLRRGFRPRWQGYAHCPLLKPFDGID